MERIWRQDGDEVETEEETEEREETEETEETEGMRKKNRGQGVTEVPGSFAPSRQEG